MTFFQIFLTLYPSCALLATWLYTSELDYRRRHRAIVARVVSADGRPHFLEDRLPWNRPEWKT